MQFIHGLSIKYFDYYDTAAVFFLTTTTTKINTEHLLGKVLYDPVYGSVDPYD